jgi:hypothetical protein
MSYQVLTISNLVRCSQIVLTDFGPSFSVLLSVLALGAWFLGLQLEVGLLKSPDLPEWL